MSSISQFWTNLLKERIKSEISEITNQMVDGILNSLTSNNYNKYIALVSEIEENSRKLIAKIIKETFEGLDFEYSNTIERKRKYVINKSNVERTLITIFGEIKFKRTYFK